MPTLSEIMMRPQEEPEHNQFYSPDAGLLSNTLGSLALIFGAPTRAAQGGILAASRGEDVVKGATSGGLGYGTEGEWGKGEVVSGLELLEEMGLVEDKEHWGNIIAGIGVDLAFDMATFSFLGSAARAGMRTGRLGQMGFKGQRIRPWGDKFVSTDREAARIKRQFITSLDPTQQSKFIDEATSIGNAHAQRIFDLEDKLQKIKLTPLSKTFSEAKRFSEARKVDNEIMSLMDTFSFNNLELKLNVPDHQFQKMLYTPGPEALAREGGGIVDRFTQSNLFTVRDFSLSAKHLGARRPPTYFDITFPTARRFLRDVIPANLPRRMPPTILKIRDARKTPVGKLTSAISGLIPPQLSPFDFSAVLRGTGIMGPTMRGHNLTTDLISKSMAELEPFALKAGVKKLNAQDLKLGKIAFQAEADPSVLSSLNKHELAFLTKRREIQDRLARSRIIDPDTGLSRQVLPEEHFRTGEYFHRIRTDTQDRVARDFMVLGEDGYKWNLVGDMPKDVHATPLFRRLDDTTNVNYSIMTEFQAYTVALARKQYMEPALKQILPDIARLNQRGAHGMFRAAQDSVQTFLGNYSAFDGWADDLLMKLGIDSRNAATKLSVVSTAWAYRAMLGLNPRTTLLQLNQGLVNNTMHLGMVDSLKGFFSHVTMSGGKQRAILKSSKINNEWMQSLDKDFARMFGRGVHKTAMDKVDKVLFSGINAFDNFNRGWAFHGGMSLAKRAGMDMESAILQGMRAANETQFIYGKLGASPLRNNPLGRVMLQFQSYSAKQLSFMARQFRRDPGTQMLRYLSMSGMMTRHVGKHIDISSELTPTTPSDIANITSFEAPVLQPLIALWDYSVALSQEASKTPKSKRVVDPEFAKEQLSRALFSTIFPGATMFNRFAKYGPTLSEEVPADALLGVTRTGGKGEELDKFGRKIKDLTPAEAALGIVGFRTTESALQREEYENMRFAEKVVRSKYEYHMTEAMRDVMAGRDPSNNLRIAGIVSGKRDDMIRQGLRMRIRNRQLTVKERQYKKSSTIVKEQFRP